MYAYKLDLNSDTESNGRKRIFLNKEEACGYIAVYGNTADIQKIPFNVLICGYEPKQDAISLIKHFRGEFNRGLSVDIAALRVAVMFRNYDVIKWLISEISDSISSVTLHREKMELCSLVVSELVGLVGVNDELLLTILNDLSMSEDSYITIISKGIEVNDIEIVKEMLLKCPKTVAMHTELLQRCALKYHTGNNRVVSEIIVMLIGTLTCGEYYLDILDNRWVIAIPNLVSDIIMASSMPRQDDSNVISAYVLAAEGGHTTTIQTMVANIEYLDDGMTS